MNIVDGIKDNEWTSKQASESLARRFLIALYRQKHIYDCERQSLSGPFEKRKKWERNEQTMRMHTVLL